MNPPIISVFNQKYWGKLSIINKKHFVFSPIMEVEVLTEKEWNKKLRDILADGAERIK